MSELRQDSFTGRWTVIAVGRSARPNDHASRVPEKAQDPDCPFCEGREELTPPEVAAVRPGGGRANGPGWTVRTIPNKFPTLAPPGAGALGAGGAPGPFATRPGRGIHEVVIEGPRHAPGLAGLAADQQRTVFRVLRDRLRVLEAQPGIASVVLFENWGPESGGTLWHPHAQLVATELVPPRLAEEAERFGRGAENPPGGCVLESVTDAERSARVRVLADLPTFTVVTPFGSDFPYEMRFVPRRHAPSFSAAGDAETDDLARLLPAALRALDAVAPGASYNWVVHGLPPTAPGADRFHWHVEILPRIVRADGFELGSGVPVNPVPPELAAERLGALLDTAL